VHWWRDSLLYCGPGFDWRYEGIILGYLELSRRTGEQRWLDKAIRAGDDLAAAQLPNANFRSSGFERNPATAGTPHEAAADAGLLALAGELKRRGAPGWSRYLAAARRNLEAFYVARLWDEEARLFRDDSARPSFVPNKAATLVEALFRLADLTGEDEWVGRYARPTLEAILRHQVRRPGDPLDGAIAQNSFGRTVVEKYFPYYVARCIPALVEAARRYQHERYLAAALAAGAFVLRWRDPDGAFPQVIYPHGRLNRYPRWVAGVGDVLRALTLLRRHGLPGDLEPTRRWLLTGQLAGGAFKPAEGFGSQVAQRPPSRRESPDARDLLPVVGWNDKALRYLAAEADLPPAAGPLASGEQACAWRGRPATYREDETVVEVTAGGASYYRWRKDETWASAGTRDPRSGATESWA
jgi:hypothetical protein